MLSKPMNNLYNKYNKMSVNKMKSMDQICPVLIRQSMQNLSTKNRSPYKDSTQNPQRGHENLSKVNMQLIFQANKQYLMDKIMISQIPKPSKYYHKIPSKTPNTTYNNQFYKTKSSYMNKLKIVRKDNLFNCKNNVTDYESLYTQNFNHNQRCKSVTSVIIKDKIQRKGINQYRPNQAPTFLDTSYALNYPGNYNPIPAQSAKRQECRLMGGGRFEGESTYHGVFKSHEMKKQQPIRQTNNKIFMNIEAPKQTTYEKQFNTIRYTKPANVKTSESKIQPKSARKGINSQKKETYKEAQRKEFTSQYRRSFNTIRTDCMNKQNVSLMSIQQMKNLILNVL